MKTLQNNFTTPEQSTRLLELGVPADSADGFYSRESYRGGQWERPRLFKSQRDKVNFKSVYEGGVLMYLPLFTVGRLIEICDLCNNTDFPFVYSTWGTNRTDYMIKFIKSLTNCGCLDFSKLED